MYDTSYINGNAQRYSAALETLLNTVRFAQGRDNVRFGLYDDSGYISQIPGMISNADNCDNTISLYVIDIQGSLGPERSQDIKNALTARLPEYRMLNAGLAQNLRDLVYISRSPSGSSLFVVGRNLQQSQQFYRTILAAATLETHAMWVDMSSEILTQYRQGQDISAMVREHRLYQISFENMQRMKEEAERQEMINRLAGINPIASTLERYKEAYDRAVEAERSAYASLVVAMQVTVAAAKELQYFKLQPEDMEPFPEMVEYIRKHRLDTLLYVDTSRDRRTTRIAMTVKSYFSPHEDDLRSQLRTAANNSRHTLNTHPHAIQVLQDMLEGKVRLPIAATYSIYFKDNRFDSIQGVSSAGIPEHMLRNQHIVNYDCFSSGKTKLHEYAKQQDFVGFYEQLLSVTSSVNVNDGTVWPEMMSQLVRRATLVELMDGTKLSIGGYYDKVQDEQRRADAERNETTAGSDEGQEQQGDDRPDGSEEDTEQGQAQG